MTDTLAIDVGGTSIKAALFDADGRGLAEPLSVATPYPCPPSRLMEEVASIARARPSASRIGLGFPGLLRSGRVVWVNSLMRREPRGDADPVLVEAWTGFALEDQIAAATGLATIAANDADVAALATVTGSGLECVITLGTGFGFSLADDGRLLPHLEMSEAPFGNGHDYEFMLGQAALERDGVERWMAHVDEAVGSLRRFLYFDHLFIGGGNARLVHGRDFGADVSVVGNVNGLVGGFRLWVPAISNVSSEHRG